MTTFLLVTHGSDGDVLPFVRIGGELVGRGHRVALLTHAPHRNAAMAAGLDFIPIDGADEFERMLATTSQMLGERTMSWRDFYRGNGLFEQIRRECEVLLRLHKPGDTVLVGRHTSAVSVRFVAEIVQAPVAWIAVSPSQVMSAPIAAHVYGTELASDFDAVRDGLGLSRMADWHAWFTRSTSEIGLWPDWFDRAGYRSPPRTTLTGFPLGDERSPGDLPAMPYSAETILATGGTGRMLHPDYYPQLVAAVARAGRPTLLVVRHRDLLPAKLPANVAWYPRLSFPHVIPRVAAIVHHGGIGTLIRGLHAGTPQVLLPDGVDRPDNGARLAHLELARVVGASDWDTETIAEQILAAGSDHGYRARAAEVTGGQRANGVVATADHLEALRPLETSRPLEPSRPLETSRPLRSSRLSARVGALSQADLDRLRARLHHRAASTPPPGTGGQQTGLQQTGVQQTGTRQTGAAP